MPKLIDRVVGVVVAAIVLLFIAIVPFVWELPDSEEYRDGV